MPRIAKSDSLLIGVCFVIILFDKYLPSINGPMNKAGN